MNPYSNAPKGSKQFQDDCTGENFVRKIAVSQINRNSGLKTEVLTTFMSLRPYRASQH